MSNLFRRRTVRTVAEYADVLAELRENRVLWFRGQTERWPLLPGLARRRRNWLAQEARLTKRFRQDALALVDRPPDGAWGWLLLMQHHGVPTRLLDWTDNSLAALYFASVSMRGRNTARRDGVVWCLDPVALNRESIPGIADIPCLDIDAVVADYLPDRLAGSPIGRPPAAVLAMRQFPRLVAQSGVFTLIHREAVALETMSKGAYVGEIRVPGTAKANLARELGDMGVTRLSLFPDLESLGQMTRGLLR